MKSQIIAKINHDTKLNVGNHKANRAFVQASEAVRLGFITETERLELHAFVFEGL